MTLSSAELWRNFRAYFRFLRGERVTLFEDKVALEAQRQRRFERCEFGRINSIVPSSMSPKPDAVQLISLKLSRRSILQR